MRRLLTAPAVAFALAVAAPAGQAQPPEASPQPGEAAGEAPHVVATGEGGELTQAGVDAYIDALEFVLAQTTTPKTFDDDQRAQIGAALAERYEDYPVELQEDLANLPAIWSHYVQTWPMIAPPAKRDFAFTILMLAFGRENAARAVGIDPGEQGGATGEDTPEPAP